MFRRYEPHLLTILQRWPEPTAIIPAPLAATTFSARLRDAISSVIEYQWTTAVDVARLKALWESNDLIVATKTIDKILKVVVGKRGSPELQSAGLVQELVNFQDYSCEVDNPSRAVIHALAILFTTKTLIKPAKITNLDPNLRREVESQQGYDVAFNDEEGITIML